MTRERAQAETHYYSEKLIRKLETLRLARAAVVEAPSGYGKTTAVRDYLGNYHPQSASVYWFTATDEEPAVGYRRLCREIEQIDPLAGDYLLHIGLPNTATVGEACDVLRRLQCKNETFLVMDNFQFLIDILPFSFTCALLDHGGEKLHIILLTQLVRRNLIPFMEGHGVAQITEAALRLSAADIQSYYAAAGFRIDEKDAAQIEHNTGGWIAAVYLHLCALRERGSFSGAPGILTLMEHLVWNTLTERQQTFLLRISPLNMVTLQEACKLYGCDVLPDDALDALSIPFIRFEPAERRYELHGILSELLNRKRTERGAAFERECLLCAGDLSLEEGKPIRAIDFYAQAKNYERILSLDLSALYFETIGDVPFYQLALQIAENCTDTQLRSFPLSMLRIAFLMLTAGMDDVFKALMERLRILNNCDGEEGAYLAADWTLLSSFVDFPDVPKMTKVLQQASELFHGRRSQVIYPDSPWCYGVYSPVSVFHYKPGEAEREAAALEEYYALYTRMTGGHGSGADILFRAEYAHYACSLNEAEILAYKAVFVAQSKKQTLIQKAATFHLAWIAMERGDSAGWRNAFDVLTGSSAAILRRSFVLPSAVDTARAMLLSELGMGDDETPEWLREGDFSGEQLPDLAAQRLIIHLGVLLRKKKFARLIGTAEAAYPQGIKVARFSEAFLAFITAAGYLGLNNRAKAMELVCCAAGLVLPGGLYAQLIVYNELTDGLVEECITLDYPEYLDRFRKAKGEMLSAFASVYPELSLDELPESLTHREKEIAMLAAGGLSNQEIAQELFLTVNTVRTHLRAVFKKLDIDRRAKLAEKLR